MDGLPPGAGTLVNVIAVVVGSLVGMAFGDRLPQRAHDVVTDAPGLVTLMMAGLSVGVVGSQEPERAVGEGVPVLVVLGALVFGGVVGSLARVEERMEGLAGRLQAVLGGGSSPGATQEGGAEGPQATGERFVRGWTTASLLFCVGR
ncbi:DUF554 family protein [Kytococcus sp. Marseille-QA3725]